ncbi:MAG TPA: ATP-binding protein [Terracidiphilus sp.]|jgi:signal transduction histidine kinase|nr:ATP-binding protein [Terracidiphilus sp.]
MLNLTQRLILGCALLAGLTVWLGVAAYHPLTIAGHSALAVALPVIAVAIAVATILLVLWPIRAVARATRRIAQGDLEHHTEYVAHDSFGLLTAELNRLAIRLRDLRDSEAGRRQMEFQLSDAVLQSIFEPIIVTDGKGHLLKVNQAAAELLGESASDRMALTNTPGGGKILSAIRDAVAMQKPVAGEGESALLPMRFGKADRSFRLRTTPMRDSEGRLLGTVTTLEDVTSLQNTDRFKTQFIAVASRKLRDPLLQVQRGLYALAHGFAGSLTTLQCDLVTAAVEDSQKLDDLMADLIEVSEIDVGKREMKLENLRPLALLREAEGRYADQAAQKHIDLNVRCFADLSPVRADRRAVRSIFDNLLTNALRFTPAEGQILLAAEEIKDFVQFMVRDSGRGIEAERLANIFDRFNTSSESSTGMGLALVRRLVESLGGQIAVESRLGNGTTFRFTLPVAAVEALQHPVEVG